jgi:flagella basal body P-ring formation protein FlgA
MVPVLSRSLKAGDIISSTDMSYIDVRQRDLPKGALSQIADLQGMAAAKALIAGRPIRNVDIALPRMVDRGEMVTLFYNEGPVSLSIKGKALQNGAQGEMVRIVNLSSNKQLQGMVTGMNQVTIY